ncbi:transcriptional regulator [Acinetobacter sp. ANC 4558]|uniref:transcriptional regulator n=1 Tax=Acinetobacter sp. ANC 4558 TaxID=1977876 RepID=UPI000A32D058|nr:transcriptional regulator [Acinetobacter sp. ANC 4558]OTG85267.1 transcriptional regulator [Acinetobacter sp. ANC 4558]
MDKFKQWLINQHQAKKLYQQELTQCLFKPSSYVQQIENGEHILEIMEYLEYCKVLDADPREGIALIDLAISSF